MRKLLASIVVSALLLAGGVYCVAQTTPVQIIVFSQPNCAEARAFLVRASTLDSLHQSAARKLICTLARNSVWSVFDALYLLATQNSTTALLNLVSSSFALTANGSPTFTADQGYTGTDGSTTVYLDTGFNPSSASSPKFTQNSAHVSVWNNTLAASSASGGVEIGLLTTSTVITAIFSKYSDNNSYYQINDDSAGGASGGIARSDPRGLHVANRSGTSAQQANFNSVDQGLTPDSSTTVSNGNIYILAWNTVGTGAGAGTPHQIMAASIGGSMTPAQVAVFYEALRAYLVTIAGITY